MSRYKLHNSGTIILRDDGMQIPTSTDNWAYREYLVWDAVEGNNPDPADPAPLPDPQDAIDKDTMGSLASQYTTLKNGMATINNHMDAILAGPANPTAAQTGTALKTIAQDMKTTMTGLGMVLDTIAIFARRGA